MAWLEASERFEDGMARICGIYGMNPLLGRLWGALFLAPEPLALEDLAARVGAAKSTVSVAIRKLVDARVVRRSWRRGDRRDFYAAVHDPHETLREVVARFVRPELTVWAEVNGELSAELAAGAPELASEVRALLAGRVAAMQAFVEAFERGLAGVDRELGPGPRRITVEFRS